ncbi:GIY-YIG nuclease family protein [Jiulongibacter sediminis]|uniref:GIY-YIG nuclease family protein n=1 Tax=Jiulongibacter sediminis TaxID=1605367 RepID=UPI0026F05405|nr:GIY-YIG nuclease family protein [Jiulongibacter sediminis]
MRDICCYILWSDKFMRFYIGACQYSLEDRIEKHNSGFYRGKHCTKQANDWRLFLKIEAIDYTHAIRIERSVKSMKSSVYIRNLKKYPELVENLKETTKS